MPGKAPSPAESPRKNSASANGVNGTNGKPITDKLVDSPPATDENPFADGGGVPRGAHFVRPELVAEIVFGEWTRDGHLRHPVFHGLRTDKPAAEADTLIGLKKLVT